MLPWTFSKKNMHLFVLLLVLALGAPFSGKTDLSGGDGESPAESTAASVPEQEAPAVSAAQPANGPADEHADTEADSGLSSLPEGIVPFDPKQTETVEVVATGYTAGKESTGKSPGHPEYGITYSGVKVRRAVFSTIAADPRIFPIGTILYIPGYGFGVVADTGSKIKGYKIDLYFDTKRQVYEQWGKKTVKVSVLRRGDGKLTETMLDQLNGAEAVLKSADEAIRQGDAGSDADSDAVSVDGAGNASRPG